MFSFSLLPLGETVLANGWAIAAGVGPAVRVSGLGSLAASVQAVTRSNAPQAASQSGTLPRRVRCERLPRCLAGTEVTFTLVLPSGPDVLGDGPTTADASGVAKVTFTIPAGTEPGTYDVVTTGTNSAGDPDEHVVRLTVTARPAELRPVLGRMDGERHQRQTGGEQAAQHGAKFAEKREDVHPHEKPSRTRRLLGRLAP